MGWEIWSDIKGGVLCKLSLTRFLLKLGSAGLTWMDTSPGWGLVEKGLSTGTSLAVQWVRLHAPNAGGPGSFPGQGTRSHMLQWKIPHATTKTQHSQINKKILKKKKKDLAQM